MKAKERPGLEARPKLQKDYEKLQRLLGELSGRDLPAALASRFRSRLDALNEIADGDPSLRKQVRKTYQSMMGTLQREMKWVPKGHYQSLWTGLGMAAIGIPLGVAFGLSLGNMAFMGIGLPIGLAIGISVGAGLDKKAAEEGRQLNL
jgi:hypothetical protein